MYPFMTPAKAIELSMKTGLMLAEAQMVIAMRGFGMMGLWRVTPAEQTRMVAEKIEAGQQAAMAATRAALSGASPVGIAHAALKPVARRTSANVKRLARRGPGSPT